MQCINGRVPRETVLDRQAVLASESRAIIANHEKMSTAETLALMNINTIIHTDLSLSLSLSWSLFFCLFFSFLTLKYIDRPLIWTGKCCRKWFSCWSTKVLYDPSEVVYRRTGCWRWREICRLPLSNCNGRIVSSSGRHLPASLSRIRVLFK